jgi:hypothetical protein
LKFKLHQQRGRGHYGEVWAAERLQAVMPLPPQNTQDRPGVPLQQQQQQHDEQQQQQHDEQQQLVIKRVAGQPGSSAQLSALRVRIRKGYSSSGTGRFGSD